MPNVPGRPADRAVRPDHVAGPAARHERNRGGDGPNRLFDQVPERLEHGPRPAGVTGATLTRQRGDGRADLLVFEGRPDVHAAGTDAEEPDAIARRRGAECRAQRLFDHADAARRDREIVDDQEHVAAAARRTLIGRERRRQAAGRRGRLGGALGEFRPAAGLRIVRGAPPTFSVTSPGFKSATGRPSGPSGARNRGSRGASPAARPELQPRRGAGGQDTRS